MKKLTLVLICLGLLGGVGCDRPASIQLGTIPQDMLCFAVLPFEVRYDTTTPDEMISEFLALDLYSQGMLGVLGPRELTKIFEAAQDSLPPNIDHYWARVLGKKLGVDGVIFGSISQLPLYRGEKAQDQEVQFNIDAYLMDVRSGEVRWTYGTKETVEADHFVNQLDRHSSKMTRNLLLSRREKGPFGKPQCWQVPASVAKAGTALSKPKEEVVVLTKKQEGILAQLKKEEGLTVGAEIFKGRTSQLTKISIPVLRDIGMILKSKMRPETLEIQSHVDGSNNTAEDLTLSKERAEAVKAYLVSLGIAERRMEAVGFGSTQPKLPNINQRSRLMNRRLILRAK